ncbi:MAG: hypothetical protein FWG06_00775 [Clostridiales bacterium]|nr:hypothetical protein [Clostridiales bacterium]
MTDNIHAGHRRRLKERYLEDGLDSFSEHQVLELLLYYALPRGDTNALAHSLIARYGSLPGLLDADYEDLRQQSGLGEHTALLLTLLPDLWRYYQVARSKPQNALNDRKELLSYVVNLFIGEEREAVYLICLDAQNKVIRAVKLSEGAPDSVGLEPRAVAEAALRCRAVSVVLCHNHPGGSLKPSSGDIAATNQLTALLGGLGITVLDHIVSAGGKCISFAEKGLLKSNA